MKKKTELLVLNLVVLIIALASIAFAFAGLPGNFDTEPLLAFGILLLVLINIYYMRE